jgi:hypothetical protein
MKKKTDMFNYSWGVEKQLSVKAFMRKYIKNIESVYCAVNSATAFTNNGAERIIYVHCTVTTKDGQSFMHPIHISSKDYEDVEEFMNKKVPTDKVSVLVLKPTNEKDNCRIYRALIKK